MNIFSLMSAKISTYSNVVLPKRLPPSNNVDYFGNDGRLDIIIWLLKIFGSCPLSSVGTASKFYTLNWAATSTILSALAALYFLFCYIIVITHVVFGNFFLFGRDIRQVFTYLEQGLEKHDASPGKSKESSVQQAFLAVTLLVAVYEIVIIVLSWKSSLKFADYLNNWVAIQKQFSLTFPTEYLQQQTLLMRLNKQLKPTRSQSSKKWFHIGLISYVTTMGLIPLISMLTVTGVSSPVQTWLLLSCVIHQSVADALEDAKNVMIYKSLDEAFAMIRSSIKRNMEWEKVDEFHVQSWRHILKQIQDQCELAGTALMPMQLSFLCHVLISGTVCVYVSLTGLGGSRISAMVAMLCGSLCVMWLGRLYFKVLMAEKITLTEASIAKDLVQMNSAKYSAPVLAQIRLTYDALVQNPSRINFGNYVVLNKHLFLGIVSQVITYLIVLMQFFQVNLPTL